MTGRQQQKRLQGKEKRAQRRLERLKLSKAVRHELREHKSSFLVFWILRLLVLLTLVRQALRGNYESVFYCVLTLLLLYLPSLIQVKLKIELPPALEISIFCFIFAAEILGEINAYYITVPYWDTVLHTINGFLAAAIGFSMVVLLNDNDKIMFNLSPIFMALLAFCFSMTIGVLWEFFEYGMDMLFHSDMQKDSIIHMLNTVELDPTRSNKVVSIVGINEVVINGRELGLGGYLDIGLIDTMRDLMVNFLGAIVFSCCGFIYVKNKGKGRNWIVRKFVPYRKLRLEERLEERLELAKGGATIAAEKAGPGAGETDEQ